MQPAPADLGLTLRHPTLDDVEGVAALCLVNDLAEFGEPDTDVGEMRDFWRRLDLASDAWLLTDANHEPVAYAELDADRPLRLEGWVLVHPDWRRRGLGTHLAGLVEERARQIVPSAPDGARVTLAGWVNAKAVGPRAFVTGRGFVPRRRFWRMRIDMGDEPPAPPSWPEGITVRPYVPGTDDRAVFEAAEDAFNDHWGHVPNTFEWWMKRTEGETFDPSLWFLAMEGGEVAGTSLCSTYLGIGWVGTLGVRRPWRARGLGEALLRHSFAEFHRRGRRSVALGVDAESVTGATRLYERAGMHVDRVHELSTKILRDGADLSTA